MLEKALAKCKGSYEDIESNISEDAKLFFPCTFSTHKHISENDDEVMEFNQIYSHVYTGSMVTWSTFSEDREGFTYEELGLKKNHIYLVRNFHNILEGLI